MRRSLHIEAHAEVSADAPSIPIAFSAAAAGVPPYVPVAGRWYEAERGCVAPPSQPQCQPAPSELPRQSSGGGESSDVGADTGRADASRDAAAPSDSSQCSSDFFDDGLSDDNSSSGWETCSDSDSDAQLAANGEKK